MSYEQRRADLMKMLKDVQDDENRKFLQRMADIKREQSIIDKHCKGLAENSQKKFGNRN